MRGNNIETTTELNPNFEKRDGLLPVVVQDAVSGGILMLAYANKEAFEYTIESGLATFYSTSRKELWTKGMTSGDQLKVINILMDCDQDAIIYQVERLGDGACHTRNQEGKARTSCFYRAYSFDNKNLEILEK